MKYTMVQFSRSDKPVKAFITGVTGQDGHYLSELLLSKGYDVYGLVRRSAQPRSIPHGIRVVEGDITDPAVSQTISRLDPQEIYHLAAMSHVGESFNIPRTTFEINAIGTIHVLEGAKACGSKFYQASTSELFGSSKPPQSEETYFHPRSPYGVSKIAAYWLTVNYREAYGLYACNGILFNHESPIRGEDFVTRKVCKYVARLKNWKPHKEPFIPLCLGNLDAKRDWGHAADFVEAMWLILQQEKPSDYVVATGEVRSVRDLLDTAFKCVGIDDWSPYVTTDKKYLRPSDVDCLIGDASKIRALGWKPKYTFNQMIKEMVDSEIASLSN